MIAHPAAIALALFLRRLHANDPIRSSVVQIFEPASEHGAPGVDELQQQTVSLLSFKSLPKAIFDAQLSFNMLARYGEEAPVSLEESSCASSGTWPRCWRCPAREGAPMPSLRLMQAPVFHGYSFSAWVEFEELPAWRRWKALSIAGIDVRGDDLEPPTNVGRPGRAASRWARSRPTATMPRPLVLDRGGQSAAGGGERGGGGPGSGMRLFRRSRE